MGTSPAPAKIFTKGHRATSSRDFNSNTVFKSNDRPATSGGRSRALTLDREREFMGNSVSTARSRPMPQEPASPRPYTAFSASESIGTRPLTRTKTAPSKRPSTSSNAIGSSLQQSDSSRMGRDHLINPLVFGSGSPSAARSAEMLNGLSDSLLDTTGDNTSDRGQSPSALRKMKSAGDIKLVAMRSTSTNVPDGEDSRNSSNADLGGNPVGLGKFMSVGSRGPMKEEYRALTATMFETPSSMMHPQPSVRGTGGAGKDRERSKWGFLKKMSKSRLRSGSNVHEEDGHIRSGSIVAPSIHSIGPPRVMGGMGGPSESVPLPHSSAANVTPGITQPPLMTASQVGFRSSLALHQTTSPQRRVLSKRPTDPVQQNSFSTISNLSSPMLPLSSTSSSFSFAQSSQMASQPPTPGLLAPPTTGQGPTPRKTKRRSFLPIDGPTPLSIHPTQGSSHLLAVDSTSDNEAYGAESPSYASTAGPTSPVVESEQKQRERYQRSLRSVMGYLRDMCDLSAGTSAGAAAVAAAVATTQQQVNNNPNFTQFSQESKPPSRGPSSRAGSRRPTLASADASRALSEFSAISLANALSGGVNPSPMFAPSTGPSGHQPGLHPSRSSSFPNMEETPSTMSGISMIESETSTVVDGQTPTEEKKVKDDKVKRAMIVKEIVT